MILNILELLPKLSNHLLRGSYQRKWNQHLQEKDCSTAHQTKFNKLSSNLQSKKSNQIKTNFSDVYKKIVKRILLTRLIIPKLYYNCSCFSNDNTCLWTLQKNIKIFSFSWLLWEIFEIWWTMLTGFPYKLYFFAFFVFTFHPKVKFAFWSWDCKKWVWYSLLP